MTQTKSGSDSDQLSEPNEQPGRGRSMLSDFRTREHARRRRNWARKQLEAMDPAHLVLVPNAVDAGDYWADVGMTLGIPERVAAGAALRGAA